MVSPNQPRMDPRIGQLAVLAFRSYDIQTKSTAPFLGNVPRNASLQASNSPRNSNLSDLMPPFAKHDLCLPLPRGTWYM